MFETSVTHVNYFVFVQPMKFPSPAITEIVVDLIKIYTNNLYLSKNFVAPHCWFAFRFLWLKPWLQRYAHDIFAALSQESVLLSHAVSHRVNQYLDTQRISTVCKQ